MPDETAGVKDCGETPISKRQLYSDPERKPDGLCVPARILADALPAEMRVERRWLLWRLEWRKDKNRGGRWDKVPYQANGRKASSTNPKTWNTLSAVIAAFGTGEFDGMGFALGDGWAGVDLDEVVTATPSDTSLWGYDFKCSKGALDLIGRFATYAEFSPSRTGLKLFGRGVWKGEWHRRLFGRGEIEVYGQDRYFTVTGVSVGGSAKGVADIQAALDELAAGDVPEKPDPPAPPTPPEAEPFKLRATASEPPADDDALIDEIRRSRQGAKFAALYDRGDASGYGGDESRADLALCNILAFWTAKDAGRMDRLFRRSALYRDKWDSKRKDTTYGAKTITEALANTRDVRAESRRPPNPTPSANGTHPPQPGPADATDKPTSNCRDSGDSSRGCGEWGRPAPLPTMPEVPPFPLAVFPPAVRAYWRAAGEALGCPVDYVAVPGMTLLGAAVGRSRAAEVKRGYAESPLFWTTVFAPPGGIKSPALRVARAPLQKAESRWLEEHKDKVTLFDTEMDRYGAEVKAWKADGCKGEPPVKPIRPVLRQATLDDTTVEATAKVLADNPRGVVIVKDELIGFVRSLNQYKSGGKGADREFWLSSWAGAPAKVNRSKDHDAGPLVIPHPFVAIAGMMCPDSLPELRGEGRGGETQADGFTDRFLMSFPDPFDAAAENWLTIPEHVERGYCGVFTHLLGMEMVPVQDGPEASKSRPYFVGFSREGRAAWEEYTGGVAAKMNALDKFDPFRGVLSKLRGYGLRFASLLWCLRRATAEAGHDSPIDADAMAGASALVDYFERHAARCLGRGWADRTSRIAHRILAWLCRDNDRGSFTRTEVFLALKDKRDVRTSETLAPAFRLLIDHDYIRPLDRPENVRPGPVPETYVVNANWNRSTHESSPKSPYSSTCNRETPV